MASPAGQSEDAFEHFGLWLREAEQSPLAKRLLPTAAALATCSAAGLQPSVRTVMVRGISSRGFNFFTDSRSQKASELLANPKAAMLFDWRAHCEIPSQVRVEGAVVPLPRSVVCDAFDRRSVSNKSIARVSQQSAEMTESFDAFASSVEAEMQQVRLVEQPGESGGNHTKAVVSAEAASSVSFTSSCPEHWCGFSLVPVRFEFWREFTEASSGRGLAIPSREIYTLPESPTSAGGSFGGWRKTRAYP